jgi:hypothetical protein
MALNLSIGYIVTIIFAVVVIVLGLNFIIGMFSNITQISDYITNQAQQDMINSLRDTNDVVSTTFPRSTGGVEVNKNSIVSFDIGVKKTSDVEDINTFSINIEPISGDIPDNIEFTYRDRINIMERDEIKLTRVDMTIHSNVDLSVKDVFGFVVYVCEGTVANCDLDSPEYYGDADFILHIN